MQHITRFRIQAGALVFEIQGTENFVNTQLGRQSQQVRSMLREQLKLMRSGKFGPIRMSGTRRRRPNGSETVHAGVRLRPGRQPVVIRDSDLQLKPRQLTRLRGYLKRIAKGGALGKDAVVFGIAWFLCREVLHRDAFSAGDVKAAFVQLGRISFAPPPSAIDEVQMLRNLAAASIGKEWVKRNSNGTFALTAKGHKIGATEEVVRPRGRRPGKTRAK